MKTYQDITTAAAVKIYESAVGVFSALLREVRELSKKKPDATLSASKVKLVNNVIVDLLIILKEEPEGKYLQTLEDDALPQVSDALMMMAQFDAALDGYRSRYHQYVNSSRFSQGRKYWITEEQIVDWDKAESEGKEHDEEGDDI